MNRPPGCSPGGRSYCYAVKRPLVSVRRLFIVLVVVVIPCREEIVDRIRVRTFLIISNHLVLRKECAPLVRVGASLRAAEASGRSLRKYEKLIKDLGERAWPD